MKVQFQAVNWEARDLPDEENGTNTFVISIFGKTEDGKSVCTHTRFNPYFFIKDIPSTEVWKRQKKYEWEDGKVISVQDLALSTTDVKQKDIWGFKNNEKTTFVKIDFDNFENMRKVGYGMKKRGWELYEFNLPPLLRFYHRTEIEPTGWISAELYPKDQKITNCDIEGWGIWREMKPLKRADQAPLVLTSFDIECHSESGAFPDFKKTEDKLIQIGCSSQRLGSTEIIEKVCFVLETEVPSHGDYKIVTCPTEGTLIKAFRDYLDDVKCDVLTGWNIFGFDLNYIFNRLKYPIRFGRILEHQSVIVEKELSSSALGNNHMFLLPMPGIFVFDLYHHIRKEYKLESYKLNSVAQHFLGDEKLDVTPHEIFDAWRSQDVKQLARVAEYCVKDTSLPIDIIVKTCSLINILEMAKATWVPIHWLIERGQQIKVFSQIAKKARELDFLIPSYPDVPHNAGYEGATVLDPHKGVHWNPVTALDFKSLYPSIMRAHNFCYSTLVMDSQYKDLPGVEYESFNVKGVTHTFAVNVPSVLPAILAELAEFRTEAKGGMKKHAGTFLAQVYDGKQLAYKVSMNSVYGFTGVTRGMLPCMAIASSVTCQGRQMIEDTKNMVERDFPGSIVRYGDTDSVMVEFKTKTEGSIQESWDMGVIAAKMATDLFKEPNELELEKIYTPFFLFSKKRYAALKYEDPNGDPEIDVKGIQLVRRDNCKMVKSVSKKVLNTLLYDRDTEGAATIVKDAVIDLIEGRVPMDQLVISKSLRDNYKSTSQPHLTVRDHMRLRMPGSEPKSGERVPYVYVDTGDKKHKQYQKAEDPGYVRENGLPVDTKYYINNQMKKSITPLFELLQDDAEKMLFDDISTHRMKQTKGTFGWNSKGEIYKNQPSITDMFKRMTSP